MPCFGLGGMGCATVETEFQAKRCRGKAAFFDHDFAFLETGKVVQPIGHIGFDLLKLRVAEDGLSALTGFLGGLEEQHHLALVGTLFAKPLGQAAEDGSVAVVAAFM